jgi:predicted TIM-barrel fold metal-dependent hydrolase
MNRRPSSYFRRQCWIAFEPGEAMLAHCVDAIGKDRIVFGTDFPHVDHDPAIVARLFDGGAPLAGDVLRAALWDNPARLMGLPEAARPRGA